MKIEELKNKTTLIDRYGEETEFYTELGIKQDKNTGEYYVYLDSNLRNYCEYISSEYNKINLARFQRYYKENIEEMQTYNI